MRVGAKANAPSGEARSAERAPLELSYSHRSSKRSSRGRAGAYALLHCVCCVSMTNLPIDAVLPDLLASLRESTRALLVAPPGAGKTTRVAPALLGEAWCSGQVLLLVPRRLAARAAAEFMAGELGEKPGEKIGYA